MVAHRTRSRAGSPPARAVMVAFVVLLTVGAFAAFEAPHGAKLDPSAPVGPPSAGASLDRESAPSPGLVDRAVREEMPPGVGPPTRTEAAAESVVVGSVVANVDGYGTPPVMSGVEVTAFNEGCSTTPPLPETCPVVGSTATNASGDFELDLPSGNYYVAAHPDSSLTGPAYPFGFGGASQPTDATGTAEVRLVVYPYVPYGNATIVLPGYVCDSGYLDDNGTAGPGCQNPVLSWSQDGAFYLNATQELVFYSFVNRTLYSVAPWTPLFERFPSYAMIPNQLLITQDGAYLYGWGTLTPTSTSLTAEAVNVSTHRVFLYNFSGVTTGSVQANGQVQLTGWNGNDSSMNLILANGSVIDHDLWSGAQAYGVKLDFFEANNLYWEPYLNGYIDVQAGGAKNDGVEEWQLAGPSGDRLERTFDSPWGAGRGVNGVNGVALNLTGRTLSFALGAASGGNTVVADLNSSGTITGFGVVAEDPQGAVQLGPGAASDRSTLLAAGPAFEDYYGGLYNASWLVRTSPGHLGLETTNLSGAYMYGGRPAQYVWSQWSQEGQFYDPSYLIAPDSYACGHGFVEACAVDGDGGAAVGTVWWYWQLGDPEFPNPVSAPISEPLPPPPIRATGVALSPSSLRIEWTPISSQRIVYYGVEWGSTPELGHAVWVPGGADSYNLTGLTSDSPYFFTVEAWNLHSPGPADGVSSAYTNGPPTPTGLAVALATDSTLHWSWTQAMGDGIDSDTLAFFSGGACSGTPRLIAPGTAVTSLTVAGLLPATTYSAYVTAWAGSLESSPSRCASGETLPGEVFPVTFRETGLPVNDEWFVNVSLGPALTGAAGTPSVTAELTNGSFEYGVTASDRRFAPSFPSRFVVNGAPLTVLVDFVPLTVPVTFSEVGLPPGTAWEVVLSASLEESNATSISFNVTNGTYAYAIEGLPGWHQTTLPYSGFLSVNGTLLSEPTLRFAAVTYPVVLEENGLPNGTSWGLLVDAGLLTSSGPSLTVALPNGSFPFRLAPPSGYSASPANGTVYVDGSNVSERVDFSRTSGSDLPTVLEVAGGLAAGTLVGVVVGVRHRRIRVARPRDGSEGGRRAEGR